MRTKNNATTDTVTEARTDMYNEQREAQTDVAVLQAFARYQLPLSAIGRYAAINGESDSRPT
ncbi:hypothetical protein WN51_11762 [Melipona quadrifasciata]|uniref:Uncharacterized protein n=1 Tax=Melipona quadrifasciata TaxID=166423 RepID=A0A0M9A4Y8_9HYME|nr:hypothetical protein WN51_11762 [Melipona quadrifasciata]